MQTLPSCRTLDRGCSTRLENLLHLPQPLIYHVCSSSDGFSHTKLTLYIDPDAIALGAIHGVSAFKGPYIPFRAGRIGATAAGPPTVPEPHQTLGEHMESFRRQGFTQSEMIALVACGHTLGGVRRGDFPTIIPPAQGPGRNQDFVTFDRTSGFDNGV